jgi:hypothetical protein
MGRIIRLNPEKTETVAGKVLHEGERCLGYIRAIEWNEKPIVHKPAPCRYLTAGSWSTRSLSPVRGAVPSNVKHCGMGRSSTSVIP